MSIKPTLTPVVNDSVFERLRLMRECPVCSRPYETNQAVVIETNEAHHLVHVTCSVCHTAIMTMVVLSAVGMSAIGLVTDLSAADARRLRGWTPISEGELLSWHKFLKQPLRLENMFQSASYG